MAYTVTATPLEGVLLLQPTIFGDERGFFFESFNQADFEKACAVSHTFVQDNHSRSSAGVLRGLHYQDPKPQGKLVRVISGEVFDVAVDLRKNSTTFGQWFGVYLNAQTHQQLWIPPGLAHGFLVVSESAEFLYKTTDYWNPEHEKSLLWNAPELSIAWPLERLEPLIHSNQPTLAAKDANAWSFAQTQAYLGA
jgi:dTDP-4-dehydrorhamnose 3,5-epimerase